MSGGLRGPRRNFSWNFCMLRYRTVRLVWDYEGRNAKYNKETKIFHDFSPCSEIVAGELVDMPPSYLQTAKVPTHHLLQQFQV